MQENGDFTFFCDCVPLPPHLSSACAPLSTCDVRVPLHTHMMSVCDSSRRRRGQVRAALFGPWEDAWKVDFCILRR